MAYGRKCVGYENPKQRSQFVRNLTSLFQGSHLLFNESLRNQNNRHHIPVQSINYHSICGASMLRGLMGIYDRSLLMNSNVFINTEYVPFIFRSNLIPASRAITFITTHDCTTLSFCMECMYY